VASTLGEGVDALAVDPHDYTHLVFVCGPLGAGEPATTLFERFAHARVVGVDLSMLQPVEEWNPFDLLLERDSSRTSRPDIALLADAALLPVVAVVLVHEQKEYESGQHRAVHEAITTALSGLAVAPVAVDTCFDPPNTTGLHTPEQVLSVIARADVVVTTRLHGLVLALKAGVPVVAIDPVAGGAKITRQAAALGWDTVLAAEDAEPAAIAAAIEHCLSSDARALARRAAERGREELEPVRAAFVAEFERET
jgi:hypothetical protein